MGHARDTRSILRQDPAAAIIIRDWRSLSGRSQTRDQDRRTLIATSGGCDSSALLLTLAAASPNLVVAHILHDFRPPAQSTADRDAVKRLASSLNLPFVESAITARQLPGNLEANSRRLRYHALAQLAHEHACPYIATAHHADDLLETMLMRLLRGTGPSGLSPIRPRRRLSTPLGPLTLIRPMLNVTRADAERLCSLANHTWQTDTTNADESHLRNALRARILPELRRLSPNVATHAATTAHLLAGANDLIHAHAKKLLTRATRPNDTTLAWPRQQLRNQPEIVLGELLRQSAHALTKGWHQDRLSHRVLSAAAQSIRSDSTDPKTFAWSPITITLTAHTLTIAANPRTSQPHEPRA